MHGESQIIAVVKIVCNQGDDVSNIKSQTQWIVIILGSYTSSERRNQIFPHELILFQRAKKLSTSIHFLYN
jgi:hypothetical protein